MSHCIAESLQDNAITRGAFGGGIKKIFPSMVFLAFQYISKILINLTSIKRLSKAILRTYLASGGISLSGIFIPISFRYLIAPL